MTELRELFFNYAQPVVSLNAANILLTLAIASVCGLLIYLMYRFFNKSVVYNANFGLLIFMVCDVTAFIIITIGANLVLSLGMVGALSIVRFRAAVKDPLDVGFLFWGVAAGLTAGAHLYLVALLGTAFIAIAYILLTTLRAEKRAFLLIIRYTPENEADVEAIIKPLRRKLKNKHITAEFAELTLEVNLKKHDTGFLKTLTESPAVISATLTEYGGEYM